MKISFTLLIIFFLSSCGVYSFTGASIDPNVKTVTVHLITNQASIVIPTLSQTFTEKLKEKFISNTNLTVKTSDGDLDFKGAVIGYTVSPIAAQANETAALNRLTIMATIEFVNHKNEKQNWTSTFSRYADFPATQDLNSLQEKLIEDITQQLVDDIFNKAVVNW